jgi:hypothetical protein
VTWWLCRLSAVVEVVVACIDVLTRRSFSGPRMPDVPVVTYTVLDDDFPAAVAELVVKYIVRWHRDPRFVLAGRAEWNALRSYPNAYVLSVENGERWYFQTVIILPVALDTFLDVVG